MFDGWPESGTHYIGVFAVFMNSSKKIEDGSVIIMKRLSSHSLSVSPMNIVVKENDTESTDTDKLSTDFGADTHIRFFEGISNLYEINVHN